MSKNIIIIGGRGRVASRLGRILSPKHTVTSIVRASSNDIANPYILDLEKASVADFTAAFEKLTPDLIYWSAGAGGKPGENGEKAEERTKAVDYEGAVKVFDAIEALKTASKPRLIYVSAVDIRNRDKPVPDYYTDKDKQMSDRVWVAIASYMKWKLEADKNLMQRTGFEWTILRPGGLTDGEGKGKGSLGRTHLDQTISRDDVASTLALLADHKDAAGFAIDLIGGETPLEEGLSTAIREKKTWKVDELL